jgi:NAD(P)H dehydrogenase (quinone)
MQKYALTGASGHLGRLTLASLLELVPAEDVIATTRNPENLAEFASRGVDVRRVDFNDPSTLGPAFAGATRLLIISTGDYKEILAGRRILQHRAAIAAAVEAGLKHISYTSCANATIANVEDPLVRDHRQTEEALSESGVAWTALRNNVYLGGVSYFIMGLRVGDSLLVPEGGGEPCWVSHEDCARTAAFVLSGRSDVEGAVEVTGPEALGFGALAQRWSILHGRKLKPVVLPGSEVIERLVANGMPREAAIGIVANASGFIRLMSMKATDTVKRVTGIAPISVDSLLRSIAPAS